jgi:hypothetical protein
VSTAHTYRGKGDDVLAEHERLKRLEERARAWAEKEALAFLHRYRGGASYSATFSLLLALARARLGLELSGDERAALNAAAAQPQEEGGEFFAHGLTRITAESVQAERCLALQGGGSAEGEGGGLRSTPSGGQAVWSATGTQHEAAPPGQEEEEEKEGEEEVVGYSSDTEDSSPPAPAPPGPSEEERARAMEVARLMTLLTSLVTSAGCGLSMSDLSAGIAAKTSRSWGAYWERRHGPLLPFLRAHGKEGVHRVVANKWLLLPGMEVPTPAPPAPAAAAQIRPAAGPSVSPLRAPSAPPLPPATFDFARGATSENVPLPAFDFDWFESSRTHVVAPAPPPAAASFAVSFTPASAPAPAWHTDASPFEPFAGVTEADFGALETTVTTTTTTRKMVPAGSHAEVVIPSTSTYAMAAAARAAQEAEDEALARALQEEENGRGASRDVGPRRASAPMVHDSRGRRMTTVTEASLVPPSSARRRPPGSGGSDTGLLPPGGVSGSGPSGLEMAPYRMAAGEAYRATEARLQGLRGYAPQVGGSSGDGWAESHRTGLETHSGGTTTLTRRHTVGPSGYGMAGGSFDAESGRLANAAVAYGDEGGCPRPPQPTSHSPPPCPAALSWADFDTLFRPFLVHGFTLIKHGRSGPPKTRRFWLSSDCQTLYWDTSRVLDALRTGERHIAIRDVVSIVDDGAGSELLRGKALRGELSSGSTSRLFSLITVTRTLDLEAASASQRKILVRAFAFLIRHGPRSGALSIRDRSAYGAW